MWPFVTNTELLNKLIAQQEKLIRQQEALLKSIAAGFAKNESLLYDLSLKLGHTDSLRLIPIGESLMINELLFNIILPPKAAPDVIEREVVIKIGDKETQLNIPGDQTLIEAYKGAQGALVEVTLVDIDDAGNRSLPSTATIELVDKISPPKPGQIGLEIFDEAFSEDASEDTVLVEDTATDDISDPEDPSANSL